MIRRSATPRATCACRESDGRALARQRRHGGQNAVLARLTDTSTGRSGSGGASLGTLQQSARDTAAATLLERYAGDPVVVDAALSGFRGNEGAVLITSALSTAQTPERETAIAMLTATACAALGDANPGGLAARGRPGAAEWQRSAPLRGAEIALPAPLFRALRDEVAVAGGAAEHPHQEPPAHLRPRAQRGRRRSRRRAGGAAVGTRGGPGGNPASPCK